MSFETIQHGQIEKKLSEKTDTTFSEIEMSIRVLVLMAMANGQDIVGKFEMIETAIIEYFGLAVLFNANEIDYIFSQVVGSEEKEGTLMETSLKEIQAQYLVFVVSVKNSDLKYILSDLLEKLSMFNGDATTDELMVLNTYIELLNSEFHQKKYEPILQKIDAHRSDYIYNRKGTDPKSFRKKMKNALKTYAFGLTEKDVVALYDATIFGAADEGFLITELGILTAQDDDFSVIPFSMIYSVNYDKGGMSFFYKADEKEEILIGYIPRIDNLRVFSNILAQIAAINILEDAKEEVA